MKETGTRTPRLPKTIPQLGCGPVAMVRVQKVEFKYKKPTAQGGRRTRSWVPRVGGGQIPGKSRSADRRLFHSQIFFPQLNVFSALPQWKSSRAFDCKHRRLADECQRIANEGRSPVQAGIGFIGSQDAVDLDPGMVDLFSGMTLPRGRLKLRKARDGTGRLGMHFFTQILELFFLRVAAAPGKSKRSNRKAESNQRRRVPKNAA
jgi:hypothetical protein